MGLHPQKSTKEKYNLNLVCKQLLKPTTNTWNAQTIPENLLSDGIK